MHPAAGHPGHLGAHAGCVAAYGAAQEAGPPRGHQIAAQGHRLGRCCVGLCGLSGRGQGRGKRRGGGEAAARALASFFAVGESKNDPRRRSFGDRSAGAWMGAGKWTDSPRSHASTIGRTASSSRVNPKGDSGRGVAPRA